MGILMATTRQLVDMTPKLVHPTMHQPHMHLNKRYARKKHLFHHKSEALNCASTFNSNDKALAIFCFV